MPSNRKKKLTPEDRAEAVAAYLAGESGTTVGSRYGVSAATVSRWLKEAGEKRVRPSVKAKAERSGPALDDYFTTDMSVAEVAAKYGVSDSTVYGWLSEVRDTRGYVADESPVALDGGAWVFCPRRRIRVWQPTVDDSSSSAA